MQKQNGTPLPDEAMVRHTMEQALKQYDFVRPMEVGHTVLERKIQGVTLGDTGDMVLYAAGVHGSEWITTLVLLKFFQNLCAAYAEGGELSGVEVRRALRGKGVALIPCLNVDGVEIALHGAKAALANRALVERLSRGDTAHWQANGRGVDLNHNFNAGWEILHQMEQKQGIYGPASRQYGGTHPESEPETAALTALCRRVPFRHAMALHSQGQEIYWEYGPRTPPKARLMAGVMAASSGYLAAQPEGLASHGGFKDWFIEEFGRPAFTVELGRGQNPLPVSDLLPIYERVEEMLLLTALM